MKYKRYRIVKDFGKYYVEVPFLKFGWKRLSYSKSQEVGMTTHHATYYYQFDTHEEAFNFAEEHKYGVDYESMS